MALALLAAAAVVVGAWLMQSEPSHPAGAAVVLLVWSACALSIAWSLRNLQPFSLRWDTQRWHLGSAAGVGDEPQAGRLIVALDAGAWMLLRFVPEQAIGWRRGAWLPVQRRGHEAGWHGLRCTVYSARPALLPNAAEF